MIPKKSILYSILTGACPKCHLEYMYVNSNPYNITETLKMHDHCSHCKTKYQIEPSFFYGSMYVSYGVGIAFAVAAFVICFLVLKTSLVLAFVTIVIVLVVMSPIIMRLSRNIWISLFVKYDPEVVQKLAAEE
ncbi:Protein of unknown function [Flavobacteriaceae bacterium MAR_2010_188]|nr:Protein of unknown function [Flavobacteriaceae bacterium MAR_2010_188]